MCGITGLWVFRGADMAPQMFGRFNDSQIHRGPDGAGTQHFPERRLHLGHRRLAILDLSVRGHQPMAYANGRYWLTFNGEIYNFIELRRELEDLGHRFMSNSDSEVVLAAYAQWGEECQARFNGMWAFAIWDAQRAELFLSRDRFGVKPLHYSLDQDRFAFASELKAFLALPWIDGRFDDALLRETLSNINGYEKAAESLLPGVRKLQGGHCLRVTADGAATVRRWWDTRAHVVSAEGDFAAQTARFREIFFDACRIRMRSDVAIGTSLSGGLDSSAVAATIATIGRSENPDHGASDWQRAFVACFPGTNLDEERYAREVIEAFRLKPHYYAVDEREALGSLESAIFSYESIYWVPLVGPWSIYREMRGNGVVVSLDGHGADELLGGYHFFIERELQALLTGRFSLSRYRDLKRTLAGLSGGSAENLQLGLWGDMRLMAREAFGRTRLWRLASRARGALRDAAGGGSEALRSLNEGELLASQADELRLYDEARDTRHKDLSPLGRALQLWFHDSVLPTLLRNYDRASMAHGVEVRMPFMDWRLVTYAFGLPDSSKIGEGYTKRVLRAAMDGLLPDSIRLRTNKIGFTSPLDLWMRGALREWTMDCVADQAFQKSSVWNGANVRKAVDQAMAGQRGFQALWPILNAYALQRGFLRAAA
ncbi:MAG: asparagine synthase (glutamine-hydrolyzing) [Alphaproteobacteria bacterium]